MRHLRLVVILFSFYGCSSVFAQTQVSDGPLLSKARGLYDAPFARNLISFDCAVRFDWRDHFLSTLGTVPPSALPTIQRLQALNHRVFVDRSGAATSEIPRESDLSGTPHGADLEQVFKALASSGLNAWLPFATNVILPVGPTKFSFQKSDLGYKLDMNGPGIAAMLSLSPDLRITNVVSQHPQPLRFATEFVDGPDGYLLRALKTSSTTAQAGPWESRFAFTYKAVNGFQLPAEISVVGPTNELWRYALDDCKVVSSITVEVEPPK